MPAHINEQHATVAVVFADHGAAHLDQRRPERIQRGYVEFGCGVEPSGGDGTRRRQHAVTADELAGVVLADQQMIAELVEAVGVSTVGGAFQGEARFGGEHIMTKALRGFDERRVGGQQQGVARTRRRRGRRRAAGLISGYQD